MIKMKHEPNSLTMYVTWTNTEDRTRERYKLCKNVLTWHLPTWSGKEESEVCRDPHRASTGEHLRWEGKLGHCE